MIEKMEDQTDPARRAFLLGQFTSNVSTATATVTVDEPSPSPSTRMTLFRGPSLEICDAPTTVVGGGWQSQFARTVQRTMWTVDDERAACAQFNVGTLRDLLTKCSVHIVRCSDTPYLEVFAPSAHMAKILASSLIKVKVLNCEPTDAQDDGCTMLSELRLGHDTVVIRCEKNPDKNPAKPTNAEFLIPETENVPDNSVLAFRATIHVKRIGYMNVETIAFPSLELPT